MPNRFLSDFGRRDCKCPHCFQMYFSLFFGTLNLNFLISYSEVDESGETLNKKIRNAEVAQWNFTLGELEVFVPS